MDAKYPMGIASLTAVKTLLIWRGTSPLSQARQAVNTQFPNEFVGLFGSPEAAARWPLRRIMSLGQSAKFLMRMFPHRLATASMHIPGSHIRQGIMEIRFGGVGGRWGAAWFWNFEVFHCLPAIRLDLLPVTPQPVIYCHSVWWVFNAVTAGHNAKCSL